VQPVEIPRELDLEFAPVLEKQPGFPLPGKDGKWLLSVREFGKSYPELYQAHQRDLPTRSLEELRIVLNMIDSNKY
jgi:hypothetical protein